MTADLQDYEERLNRRWNRIQERKIDAHRRRMRWRRWWGRNEYLIVAVVAILTSFLAGILLLRGC